MTQAFTASPSSGLRSADERDRLDNVSKTDADAWNCRRRARSHPHELRKVIVGQDDVIEQMLVALFTGGHCLLAGVPGLAKTLLIKTLADILDLEFKRIQFTPDLMPSDITGTEILDEDAGGRRLRFVKGPVFAQIILADEINRTPPKTQAALLEAMQERQVTAAGRTLSARRAVLRARHAEPDRAGRHLSAAGSAARPVHVQHRHRLPARRRRSGGRHADDRREAAERPERVLSGPDILQFQDLVRARSCSPRKWRATRCGSSTRRGPDGPGAPDFIEKWVKWGAGLRASQALVRGGKARALMHGRYHVSIKDIQALAKPILRHRIMTNFYAESERINSDTIVERLLETVPLPKSGM